MIDRAAAAQALTQKLALEAAPVAMRFAASPPPGLSRITPAAPAGCTYWKLAAEGQSFYTLPEDHFGCAVGAYTHGAELGPAQQKDLEGLVGTMVGLEYLSMDEVPRIPTRKEKLEVVAYAPLASATFDPHLVFVRARPRAAMLLAVATHAAGVRAPAPGGLPPGGRMVPEVLASEKGTHSLGCIGNRVYTALPDDEIWAAIPGLALERVIERLEAVARANRELEAFHRARLTPAS